MKKLFLILATLIAAFFVSYGQEPAGKKGYLLKENISYRNKTDNDFNEYMAERCKLDLYYPENQEGYTTVIWFHGGGLTAGNKFIPERLKEKGIAVVAVNYRFSPKAKCPAYIEDAAAAVAWVFRNIGQYGGNPSKIIVSGHSAGGYLTLMVGLDKSWLAKYDLDANRIASLVPFSGHTITHKAIRAEREISDKQPVVDNMAPLFHVRADAPPLMLITGDRELEMLGRYEENAYLWRMMKISGHTQTTLFELDGFNHGGMAEPAYGLLLKEIERINKK